jgi:hypothetical protein
MQMSTFKRHSCRIFTVVACVLAISSLFAVAVMAQDHHDRDRRQERYRTPHWVYDNRYHHDHYYPSHGYVVRALPPGYTAVSFGNGRLFFQGGVWYQTSGPGFIVVQPPLGVVAPALPPAYTMIRVRNVPYYYANDVYYTAVPGGYVVTAPPPDVAAAAVQPAPAAPPPAQSVPPAGSSPPSSPGNWYYCESAKAYYPYVGECREGWRAVPATPPAPPAR